MLVAALAVVAAGCNRARPTAVAPPRWAGVTVRVAAPDGPPRLLIDRLGRAWANQGGAALSVTAPAGPWPAADLVLIPAPDLPRWVAAGKATPLPRQGDVDEFMPLYRTRLLLWDEKAYALPVLGDGPVCVYRRDLFADPAAQQAYRDKYRRPLQPPQTWDEFADLAEFFAARRARPSLPPLPADDAGLCAAFGAVAAPYAVRGAPTGASKAGQARSAREFSFQYDVDTGEPRLTEPGFAEALAVLKRAQPHRAKTPTAAEAMRADQAALGYVTLADLAGLGTEEARRWGVCRPPGSRRVNGADEPAGAAVNAVPFVGAGAVLGLVPAGAAQADAAFDLLAFLAGPDVSTEVVHTPVFGSGPFRDRHVDPQHEVGWLNYGLDQPETGLLRTYLKEVADPRVDNPALALRIPAREAHIKALAAEVRSALAGGDPAAALKSAAETWRKLDGDPKRARADYRRSVGLQP